MLKICRFPKSTYLNVLDNIHKNDCQIHLSILIQKYKSSIDLLYIQLRHGKTSETR